MVRRRVRPQPPRPGPATRGSPGPVGGRGPPPEAVQEGPQSLPSRKRGVEAALAVKPRTRAVPSARSVAASLMQSPPASADATSVIILSPVLARPGASPKVEVLLYQLGQALVQGQRGGKDQPGIVDQAMVVKDDVDAVGVVAW